MPRLTPIEDNLSYVTSYDTPYPIATYDEHLKLSHGLVRASQVRADAVKIGQTETAAPGRWSGVHAAGLRPKAHDCGGMNLL
jgi:hypothetical protein